MKSLVFVCLLTSATPKINKIPTKTLLFIIWIPCHVIVHYVFVWRFLFCPERGLYHEPKARDYNPLWQNSNLQKITYLLKTAMERRVRQLEVIFPVDGDLLEVNTSTVYSYVENFGSIVSCEKGRNGLVIRMIEADGVPMNWFKRFHEIDGHRVRMRREMHILDLPLFCLKVICSRLINSIHDLCTVTEVCTRLKDAATLAFEGKFSKSGTRITLKNQMQADVRLYQSFLHSITRLEINAEDTEHFAYILASLKKMSPNNVLKCLIFSSRRVSYWLNLRQYGNRFSHLSTAEVEELFPVFSHLEALSYNTWELVFPRLPPKVRILSLNFLYDNERLSETSDVINANLQKVVIRSTCIYSITKIAQLLQSSPQIKEITIYGWEWAMGWDHLIPYELYKIDDILQYAPQLEVLNIYTATFLNPSIESIQTFRKMRNLKILNLSLSDPPIELLNAINELNVVVQCLSLFCRQWNYELSLSIRNFNQLKLLRIKGNTSLEGLPELVGRLPQLSVLVLKRHVITVANIKKILSAGSKITDFHVGQLIDLEQKLDTKQYLEIVSAVRGRSNGLHLRIWLTKQFSTNIDSKVYCDNVKYVSVLLKHFKYKSYPPCGFTV